MEKSQNKLKSFFDKLNNTEVHFDFDAEKIFSGKKLYFFAFLIPMIILFAAYMIFGIYPAGRRSVLAFDLNAQYVSYYENFRDAFRGNRSLVNSWSRSLSGETVGLFAYYLASPFMLLILILPRSLITEAILIMQLLKVGTASAAFSIYLRHSKKAASCTALIFSLLYGLMSYMAVQLINPMWLEGVIYLPLICLGIERLIDKGKMLWFVIPMALMFAANFYIGWMLVIFSCLYFLAYYFFLSDSDLSLRMKDIFRCGLKFAFCGILSAVCAAWVLVPTYFSLSMGKLGLTEAETGVLTNFALADFFVNLLPNTYDTVYRGGAPLVYCGVLTVLLIPMYFFNGSIPLKKRVGSGVLAAGIVLSMYIYPVDIIWHGFQLPYGIPYRYAFLLSFLLLVMAVQAFEKIEGTGYGKLGLAAFLVFVCIMYAEKMPPLVVDTNGGEHTKIHPFAVILFSMIMLSVYVLLLYFHKKFYRVKPVPVVIAVFTAAELLFTTAYTVELVNDDVLYLDRDEYNRYTELGRNTLDQLHDIDGNVYRVEKEFSRTVNDNMSWGNFGISHSGGNVNVDILNFLRYLGFPYGRYHVSYGGATYVTDSVLGIKYVMEKEKINSSSSAGDSDANSSGASIINNFLFALIGDDIDKGSGESVHYDKLVLTNEDSREIINVYENPYALPIAFMADEAIAGVRFETWEDPFENQNILFSALLSDEKQDFFKRISIDELSTENLRHSVIDSYNRYEVISEDSPASLEFELTGTTDDMIYMFLSADQEHRRTVNLWLNGKFLNQYLSELTTSVIALGRHNGETFSVKADIASSKNEVFFKDAYFCYLDEEMFAAAIEELKRQPLEIESFSEDHIKGTVTAEKDGILFTSIAYEPGWTVLVDGEKTEPVKLMDALMGIPVTAGTHSIEMKFFPKGLTSGIALSVPGIIAVVIIGIYENKKRGTTLPERSSGT